MAITSHTGGDRCRWGWAGLCGIHSSGTGTRRFILFWVIGFILPSNPELKLQGSEKYGTCNTASQTMTNCKCCVLNSLLGRWQVSRHRDVMSPHCGILDSMLAFQNLRRDVSHQCPVLQWRLFLSHRRQLRSETNSKDWRGVSSSSRRPEVKVKTFFGTRTPPSCPFGARVCALAFDQSWVSFSRQSQCFHYVFIAFNKKLKPNLKLRQTSGW